MPRILLVFSALLLLVACGVPTPATYRPTPSKETELPLCGAEIAIVGQIENRPAAPQGCGNLGMEACHPLSCWPVGVWRFTAQYKDDSSTCDSLPQLDPEYMFQVTRDDNDVESYAFGSTTQFEFQRVKVTSGGGGLCEGSIELTTSDGMGFLNLKPALQEDGRINGFGEYDTFEVDQR